MARPNNIAEFQLHLQLVANTVRDLRSQMGSLNVQMKELHRKVDTWGSVLNNTECYV